MDFGEFSRAAFAKKSLDQQGINEFWYCGTRIPESNYISGLGFQAKKSVQVYDLRVNGQCPWRRGEWTSASSAEPHSPKKVWISKVSMNSGIVVPEYQNPIISRGLGFRSKKSVRVWDLRSRAEPLSRLTRPAKL